MKTTLILLMTTFASLAQEPAATKAAERTYAFRTMSGFYLTAENGGENKGAGWKRSPEPL